jgi:hypothetical protein
MNAVRGQWPGSDQQPTLQDMLSDPIVQLLMIRDGVTSADVVELVTNLQAVRASKTDPVILRLSAE